MSLGEILGFVAAAAAGGAFLLSLFNARMLATVQHQTNSMHAEIVRITRVIALAEGDATGRASLLREQKQSTKSEQ